jgi:hypothetical protein
MPHLHLLPDASMAPRAPQGFVRRQRTPVPGADIDTLDDEVIAAGGKIMGSTLESKSLRPGRWTAQTHDASWYVIPADAVEPPAAL